MLAYTVDWFSHNIPVWTELFDSLGWLNSSTKLRVLEVSGHIVSYSITVFVIGL